MLVRLMTYNILDGGAGRGGAIRSIVRENRPDILVIQEATDEELAASLARDNDLMLVQPDSDGGRCVRILSRFPVVGTSTARLAIGFRRAVRVDLNLGSVAMSVVGAHPIAYPAWCCELLRVREAEVHLRLANGASAYKLVVGDMNAVAPGDPVRLSEYPGWLRVMLWLQGNRAYPWAIGRYLRAGYVDLFRVCNPRDAGWTLPAQRPNTRLDYILASQQLAQCVRGSWVVESPVTVRSASDHLPVMAVFEL